MKKVLNGRHRVVPCSSIVTVGVSRTTSSFHTCPCQVNDNRRQKTEPTLLTMGEEAKTTNVRPDDAIMSHISDEEDDDSTLEENSRREERHGEDVMEMAMAEKSNALLRGKSADFDRMFALPRWGSRSEVVPEDDVEQYLEGTREESSSQDPTSSSIIPALPGAFRVGQSRQRSVADTSVDMEKEEIIDNLDRTFVVPEASLVSSGAEDLDQSTKIVTSIAEVVELDATESVDEKEAIMKARRRRIFRCAVLVALIVIVAVLVAILVMLTEEERESDHDSASDDHGILRRPRPSSADMDDVPFYESDVSSSPFTGFTGFNNTYFRQHITNHDW
jgi:hypothetical protein